MDLIMRMSVEALLRNKIQSAKTKEDLNFDVVRQGRQWKIDASPTVLHAFVFTTQAVDTMPNQVTLSNSMVKFLCACTRTTKSVDLFFDCQQLASSTEFMSWRRKDVDE